MLSKVCQLRAEQLPPSRRVSSVRKRQFYSASVSGVTNGVTCAACAACGETCHGPEGTQVGSESTQGGEGCGRPAPTDQSGVFAGACGAGGIVPGALRLCDGEDALAELIAEFAAGRLSLVRGDNQWLAFHEGAGWLPVADSEMLKGAASVGRANLGSKDSDGSAVMNPRTGSRATTAAGVLRLLQGCDGVGTQASAWDSDPAVVGVGGDALDLRTGTVRPAVAADRLRRRLAAAPADDAAYAASRWPGVVEHVVPDPLEREYLQRLAWALALMQDGPDVLLMAVRRHSGVR